jgi:hypothetical protein
MSRLTLKSLMAAFAVSIGLAALAPTAGAFNPQPEPPKAKKGVQSKFNSKAFNPQPDPPKFKKRLKKKARPGLKKKVKFGVSH